MIQVRSDYTNQLEDATVSPGILGSDGKRYGAIADIDLFAMFNYQDENDNDIDFLEALRVDRRAKMLEGYKEEKRAEAEAKESRIMDYQRKVEQFGYVWERPTGVNNEDASSEAACGYDSAGNDCED